MDQFLNISQSSRLAGEVKVSGAKNGALPLVIASLLTDQAVCVNNVPELSDLAKLVQLLRSLGASVDYAEGTMNVDASVIASTTPPSSLIKSFRASFWVLAPLLARCGQAQVFLPGGDIIGTRPVDIHLQGLQAMGAEIEIINSVVYAKAEAGLKPTDFTLSFPSVGATHQLIMAASLVVGETVLRNVAREPEVVALCEMLVSMGAEISGIGSDCLTINGCEKLSGTEVDVIGDRIEAGTYLFAAMMTGGEVLVHGCSASHLSAVLSIIEQMGGEYSAIENSISLKAPKSIKPVDVVTAPYPGFPTDLQPQLVSALTVADGRSRVTEKLYEYRWGHLSELSKLGAKLIQVEDYVDIVGVEQLSGATMQAKDIRQAVAILLAAMIAEGQSKIVDVQHLHRGYANLENKLRGLGASVSFREEASYLGHFVGC